MGVEPGRYSFSQTIVINLNVFTPKAFHKKVCLKVSKYCGLFKIHELKGLIGMSFLKVI